MAIAGRGIDLQRQELPEDGDWRGLWAAWLSRHPKRRWHVRLGGRLCSLQWLEPIPGTRSIEEAEAAVSASLSAGAVPMQARLAQWSPRATRPWVAACTPSGLVDELCTLLKGSGRLLSLHPWWHEVSSPSGISGVAVRDDESVTYWRCDASGAISAAGTLLALPPAQAAVLQRLKVGGPLNPWRLDLAAWGSNQALRREEEGTDAAAGTAG
jgi:hypothetical protein